VVEVAGSPHGGRQLGLQDTHTHTTAAAGQQAQTLYTIALCPTQPSATCLTATLHWADMKPYCYHYIGILSLTWMPGFSVSDPVHCLLRLLSATHPAAALNSTPVTSAQALDPKTLDLSLNP
jgi:hypothetical protein